MGGSGRDWTPRDRGSWGVGGEGAPHGVLHPIPSSREAWGGKTGGWAHPPPGAGPGPSAYAPAVRPGPRRISPPGSWLWGQGVRPRGSPSPESPETLRAPPGLEPGKEAPQLEELGPAPPPRVVCKARTPPGPLSPVPLRFLPGAVQRCLYGHGRKGSPCPTSLVSPRPLVG